MDVQSGSRDIGTPLPYKNYSFYKAEDSGYHTSFATPTLECSSTPNENCDPTLLVANICKIKVDCYPITPGTEVRSLSRRYNYYNHTNSSPSFETTPIARRGVKRRYDEGLYQNEASMVNITTPTSIIANEVQKLKVNDSKIIKATSFDSGHIDTFFSDSCSIEYFGSTITHPSTPIKKICRGSCNLSPFDRRKSPRKVDFAIHSLSCEKQVLKVEPKPPYSDAITNKFGFKPNQKFDVIKMLYNHEDYCSTSIKKILGFLSQEDIYNFTLVSPLWCDIFKNVSTKQNYEDFFTTIKGNLENWNKNETPKQHVETHIRPLKEIQNVNLPQSTPHSPTRSPRTTRFHKFTKAASIDTRSQIICIKCRHPAKVTIESSGEEWGECTSSTCAQQFCRICKYARHPGKSCLQYDLDGPSPSKRKKNVCPVSSSKSKQKLKRLLF